VSAVVALKVEDRYPQKKWSYDGIRKLERVTGIEPVWVAWKITFQLKTKDKRVQGAASKVMKTR
jgi:hypothetical protein